MVQRRAERVLSDVGRRIAEIRSARGWTQEDLAEHLRVSAKYVQSVERGQENLTLATLAGIADELEVSVSALTRRPVTQRRVGRPPRSGATLPFEEIEPAPHELYRRCVPLVTLEARAGVPDEARLVETSAWVVPRTRKRLAPGMFVARVLGDSMEPQIAAGSWALFRTVTQTPKPGSVVLAQHRTSDDPEGAGAFVVKRLEITRRQVRLVSRNRTARSIDVSADDPDWTLIAVLVDVLSAHETGSV